MWGCGLLSLLAGQVCVRGSPARCPLGWPGDTRCTSQLVQAEVCLSGGLISPNQSPAPDRATAGTSSTHADGGIWLQMSLT